MGKVKITIKLTRYQKDKLLGERYRCESMGHESFNEWKNKLKNENRKKNKYKLE